MQYKSFHWPNFSIISIFSVKGFLFLLMMMASGCQNNSSKDQTTTPKVSGVQTESSDVRAREGDSVWVIVNHVSPDKQQVFEQFIHDVFWKGSSALPEEEQKVFRQTRVLHPANKEADGSYRYIFLMDPVIPNSDYEIESLLIKMYGEEQGNKYMKMWSESTTKQDQYQMIQSRD